MPKSLLKPGWNYLAVRRLRAWPGFRAGRTWRHAKLTLVLLLLSSFVSCRQQSGEVSQVNTNLGWLGSQYAMYVGHNKGRTPKDIDEFRKYVEKKVSAEELARLKVADASELFVSPRDGKPFEMVSYAALPPPVGGEPPPLVLYESVGKNGQRAVAFLGGGTQTLDEHELQQMLPAKPSRSR